MFDTYRFLFIFMRLELGWIVISLTYRENAATILVPKHDMFKVPTDNKMPVKISCYYAVIKLCVVHIERSPAQ